MQVHSNKLKSNENRAADDNLGKRATGSNTAIQLKDNRPRSVIQKKLVDAMADSKSEMSPIQKKENKTGLPDNLKSGVENLSGHSMDDVKVHYNSSQPAQLNANAYAQGTDIHIAPGQEKHLPHEAWHVVQQKQGRVKPTMQMKGKLNVNDDKGLENEADVMGGKALSSQLSYGTGLKQTDLSTQPLKNEHAGIQMKGAGKGAVIQLTKWKFTDGRWIKQSIDDNDEPIPFPDEAEEGDIFDDRTGVHTSASSLAKVKAEEKKRKPKSLLSFADEFEDDEESKKFSMKPMHDFEPKRKLKGSSLGKEKKKTEIKVPPAPVFTSAVVSSIPIPQKIILPNVGDIARNAEVFKKLKLDLMQSILDNQELGGYIYWNPLSEQYLIIKAKEGGKATIDLDKPPRPPEGFILVANYHTHPNEAGHQPPSPEDVNLSSARGIPSIVIAAGNKLFFSGPTVRREGGEHHDYPAPDPEGGYTGANTPQVRKGEGAQELNKFL